MEGQEKPENMEIDIKAKILFGILIGAFIVWTTMTMFQIGILTNPADKIIIDKDNNGTILLTFSSIMSKSTVVDITKSSDLKPFDFQMRVVAFIPFDTELQYKQYDRFKGIISTRETKNKVLLYIYNATEHLKPGECRIYTITVDTEDSLGLHRLKEISVYYLYDIQDIIYYNGGVCDFR